MGSRWETGLYIVAFSERKRGISGCDAVDGPQERDEDDDGELEVRPAGYRAKEWQQE
jgi:hypothetical protein